MSKLRHRRGGDRLGAGPAQAALTADPGAQGRTPARTLENFLRPRCRWPLRLGWCRKAGAGLLIARTQLPGGFSGGGLQAAVASLAERPVLADLSPCHGELGVGEALVVLAAADPGRARPHRARARHRAGLILEALHHGGPGCATPDGIATPGLLHGLAGIGHGLLRLGFADQVPSILLLEPGS